MVRLATTILLVLAVSSANADTPPPALGKTYPIAERDILDVIMERLKQKERDGEIAAMQKAMADKARHTVENPEPIPGVTTAKASKTHYYDPSVIAPNDIKDHQGNVIVAAGTRVNPLDYMGLSKVMLFVNAEDQRQVDYADQYYKDSKKPVKVILVGGKYMELMRKWKRQVYFDQGGYLVKRLGITEVPALVYQDKPEDTELRIDTVAMGGDKP